MTKSDWHEAARWQMEHHDTIPPSVYIAISLGLRYIQQSGVLDDEPTTLPDEEFEAARKWIDREKDWLTSPLKEALLKLVGNEEKRRMT